MATIAKPPRGLISIFELNDFGKVPNDLSSTIVGTFDVAELCLLNRETINGSNATSPGVGGIVFSGGAQVPAGELWYVWTFGLRVTTIPAGESIRIVPCVSTQQGFVIPIGAPRAGAAGEQIAANAETGFWLGPGTGFAVIVEQETGASKNIIWYASVVKLRI